MSKKENHNKEKSEHKIENKSVHKKKDKIEKKKMNFYDFKLGFISSAMFIVSFLVLVYLAFGVEFLLPISIVFKFIGLILFGFVSAGFVLALFVYNMIPFLMSKGIVFFYLSLGVFMYIAFALELALFSYLSRLLLRGLKKVPKDKQFLKGIFSLLFIAVYIGFNYMIFFYLLTATYR